MAVELYNTATEYLANELVFVRGNPTDISNVGVYHNINPNVVPVVGDFTSVYFVDNPNSDPLAEGDKNDVLSLVGPKIGAHLQLTPGDYQRWVLVQTSNENIIRRVDVVTIL